MRVLPSTMLNYVRSHERWCTANDIKFTIKWIRCAFAGADLAQSPLSEHRRRRHVVNEDKRYAVALLRIRHFDLLFACTSDTKEIIRQTKVRKHDFGILSDKSHNMIAIVPKLFARRSTNRAAAQYVVKTWANLLRHRLF